MAHAVGTPPSLWYMYHHSLRSETEVLVRSYSKRVEGDLVSSYGFMMIGDAMPSC